jgi:hypothetical protein
MLGVKVSVRVLRLHGQSNLQDGGVSHAGEKLSYQCHVTCQGEVQGGAPAVPALQRDVVGEQLRLVQGRIELALCYDVVVVAGKAVKGAATMKAKVLVEARKKESGCDVRVKRL